MTTRPAGRRTRRISLNATSSFATFRMVNAAAARWKVSSANGIASTLARTPWNRGATPSAAARCDAIASITGEMSMPATRAPAADARRMPNARSPVPTPMSSARSPGPSQACATARRRQPAFAQALSVVLVLVGIQLVTAFLPARGLRSAAGLLAILAGAATLGIAAIARPSQSPYDVFALVALPLGALALGGSDGAMLLGHWYLVTPKLSPAPLQRAALVVVAAAALQLALVTITAFRGDLTGSWETALTVALAIRIGVGLVITLAVAAAAWWTARLSTQSSTGVPAVAH